MIHVLVISHHSMFGHGLVSLLRRQVGIEVVGQLYTKAQALDQLARLRPTVILFDVHNLPSAKADIDQILAVAPTAKIIRLNLQNNLLQIDREPMKQPVKDVEDLIRVIRQKPLGSEGPVFRQEVDCCPSVLSII